MIWSKMKHKIIIQITCKNFISIIKIDFSPLFVTWNCINFFFFFSIFYAQNSKENPFCIKRSSRYAYAQKWIIKSLYKSPVKISFRLSTLILTSFCNLKSYCSIFSALSIQNTKKKRDFRQYFVPHIISRKMKHKMIIKITSNIFISKIKIDCWLLFLT